MRPSHRSRVLVLATATLLVVGFAGAENLVVNGSFDSDIGHWTSSGSALAIEHVPSFGSTMPGGSGPGSMKMIASYWGSGTYGASQDITIQPNTDYVFYASYFVPSAGNNADRVMIQVYWLDGAGVGIGSAARTLTPPTFDAWKYISSVTWTSPATAARARLYVRVGAPEDPSGTVPATAYFDDVTLSVAEPEATVQKLFVPAAAAIHGAAGTYWSTNGWFSNLTESTVTIRGALLRPGQSNAAAVSSPAVLGTIPARGFKKIDDLVTLLGASEVTGGIYLEMSASGQSLPATLVKATTHTFTPNPYGAGVYGQGIPAVAAGTATSTTVPGVFQGAALRTNVGALNTSNGTITLKVTILNSAGNPEVSPTWTLQPYEQRQVSLPSLGISSLDGGTVVFELQSAGSFRGYTSTVDQSSGDAVYNEAR